MPTDAKSYRPPSPRRVPKAFLGGLLSGIVSGLGSLGGAGEDASVGEKLGSGIPVVGGILSGIFGNKRRKRQLAAANDKIDSLQQNLNLERSQNMLDTFDTEGTDISSLFNFINKHGGIVPKTIKPLRGGGFTSLGNGVFLAKGASHISGGIGGDVNNDGVEDVEFEGGELFFEGNEQQPGFIVSREVSKPLIKKFKGLGKTRIDRGTAESLKQRAMVDNESRKFQQGGLLPLTPKGSRAGSVFRDSSRPELLSAPETISPAYAAQQRPGSNNEFNVDDVLRNAGNFAGTVSPFISNAVNSRLIRNTPQVPRPSLEAPARFDTDININPALVEQRQAGTSFRKGVRQSVGDQGVANNLQLQSFAKQIGSTNQLIQQKEIQETDLRNQQTQFNAGVDARNTERVNQFKSADFQRQLGIQGRQSANIADVGNKLQALRRDQKLMTNDRFAMELITRALNTDGIMDRKTADLLKRDFPELYKRYVENGTLKVQ